MSAAGRCKRIRTTIVGGDRLKRQQSSIRGQDCFRIIPSEVVRATRDRKNVSPGASND